MFEGVQLGDVGKYPGAVALEGDTGPASGLGEVELDVDLSYRGARHRQVVEEAAVVAARFYEEVFPGGAVDDSDGDAGPGDPVSQFTGQVGLYFFTGKATHSGKEGLDVQGGSAAFKEFPGGADGKVRGIFDQVQPLGVSVGGA